MYRYLYYIPHYFELFRFLHLIFQNEIFNTNQLFKVRNIFNCIKWFYIAEYLIGKSNNNLIHIYIFFSFLGPQLKNILSEDEQNIGETCFKNTTMQCSPTFQYRLMNAGCTNLENPTRGMAGSVFTRLLPALYKDSKKIRLFVTLHHSPLFC